MHASELIRHLAEKKGDVALVTVVKAKGSAPRHPGSKMIVFPDGRILGTIGGGKVEAQAIVRARAFLAAGRSGLMTAEMTGAEATGSDPICGGTVFLAIFFVRDSSAYAEAHARLERGERIVLVNELAAGDSENRSSMVVFSTDGLPSLGTSTKPDFDALRQALDSGLPVVSGLDGLLYDPVEPQDRLLILGGGHVGQALARFAAELDFRVCVGDSRPEFADPARFPAGTETMLGNFSDIVAEFPFGPSTYAVVVSPSHSTDLECVRAILKREYRYAGFIGSRRKTRMILEQAVSDGFPSERVLALRAPIGADIGAETPSEIAVSIFSEIIALRRGSPAIIEMDRQRTGRRT